MDDTYLLNQRALWDRHAAHDPLWAILSEPTKSARRWSLRDVMKSGEREIALLILELRRRSIQTHNALAIDFGCGVGRLTQALARRFDRVIGFDISPEMLRLAASLNRYPGAEYRRSDGPTGIAGVPSNSCDLVYSNIVLQHIDPAMSRTYISEFLRIARPGAVVVFQLPAEEVLAQNITVRPMTDDAYCAGISLVRGPSTVRGAEPFTLCLRVANASGQEWRQSDVGSLRAGNHWFDESGTRMVVQDDGRATLPQVFSPGEACEVLLECKAPAQAGRFLLEVDLVHEGITWFAGKGSPPLRLPVDVASGVAPVETLDQMRELDVPEYGVDEFADMLAPAPDPAQEAPPFPMFGLARSEVIDLIRDAGGSLVHIEDDGRAGPGWNGYRYFVVKTP